MTDDDTEQPEAPRRREGVRILRAEEAQAALDAGQATGRRGDDLPRYGDVPPAPTGPRPPHRFPLPDSVDPATAVPRPPLARPIRPAEPEASQSRLSADDPSGAAAADPGTEAADPGAAEPELAAAGPAAPEPVAPALPIAPAQFVEPGEPEAAGGPAWPLGPSGDPGAQPATTARHDLTAPQPAVGGDPATPAPVYAEPEPSEPAAPAAEFAPPAPAPEPVAPGAGFATPAPASEPAVPGLAVPGLAAAEVAAAHGPAGGGAEDPTVSTDDLSGAPAPRSIWDDPAARPWTTSSPPTPTFAGAGSPSADAPPPSGAGFPPEHALPEEGITMSGGSGPEMPHWTDPPTGEFPRIRGSEEPPDDQDLAAWQALGSRGMRWRDQGDDYDDTPLGDLGDEETRVGTLDSSRSDHSDLYSFDEDFSRLEEERSGAHPVVDPYEEEPEEEVAHEPGVVGVGRGRPMGPPTRPGPAPRTGGPGASGATPQGEDLTSRFLIGIGLFVLLVLAWLVSSAALVVLTGLIVLLSTFEAYRMLQRSGFRPATLLGVIATTGTVFAAYWKGLEALPLMTGLLFLGSVLWYLFGIVDARPLANIAVTTMTYLWIGLLGSFGALMLRLPHGSGLFIGAVMPALAADIAAFLVGGRVGTRLLAPRISPGKTVEGFVAGLVAALIIGAVIGKELTPWGGIKHGLVLGLAIGLLAPVGDLFESMVKRDLNVKDSSSILGGHGGLLDRFDSILLILPAAYYIAFWFHL